MVYFSIGFHDDTWFELCEDKQYLFAGFIEDEDIKRWTKIDEMFIRTHLRE